MSTLITRYSSPICQKWKDSFISQSRPQRWIHSKKSLVYASRTITSQDYFFLQAFSTSKDSLKNRFQQPKRQLSISNRLWDIIQSRSLNPSNPIVDNISRMQNEDDKDITIDKTARLDFTNYQPHHFTDAALQLQSQYESDLKKLEKDIIAKEIVDHCDLLGAIDTISRPITTLQNIIYLLSCVKDNSGSQSLSQALNKASNSIDLKHESSRVIHDALTKYIESIHLNNKNNEKARAVQYLLRKQRVNDTSRVEELKEIQERLLSTEFNFIKLSSYSMEEHGKVTPTQKLLPYIYEIIALKQYQSRLLGYDNHVAFSLDYHSCMAKSSEEISKFHESFMDEHVVQKFGSDEFLSRYFELSNDGTISPDALRDYFEFNIVIQKMFELSSTLFGINIIEENERSKVLGWDKDVRLYHVYDTNTLDASKSETKVFIGSFYLDPFRRLNKNQGEFVVPIIHKSGRMHNPIVAMSLDIRPPVWDDSPIKLNFSDVVHMFHEFGHTLQLLLPNVESGVFSGAQTIEEDASEVVSQLMEYFVFEPQFLSNLARHCESGESLPLEIIQKLNEKNQSIKRNELLHRLFLGELEQHLFSKFDPSGDVSIMTLQRNYAEKFCPNQVPSKGNIDPLIHLLDSNVRGKSSVQYRYLWSEVMSADAFELFQEAMLNNDEVTFKKLGKKFRQCFLDPGSSISTEDAFREFRGRQVNNKALLKRYGLLK